MKNSFTLLIISLFFANVSQAQDKKLIQLTGRLLNEFHEPLPYSQVLVMENFHGDITGTYGNFSLVVEESDSVLFSSVGYKGKYFVVPAGNPSKFINVDIVLQVDTLVISEARIYPWKTYDEFRDAFVNLKLPMDDMEKARRNIALIRTQIIMDYEPSARANFQHIMEQQYQQTFTQGQYPTYQIFNPFAWVKFFQALKRGDYKSKD
jgi:hypothetical protein